MLVNSLWVLLRDEWWCFALVNEPADGILMFD